MILLAYRSGRTTPAVADLHRLDDWVIALELLVFDPVMFRWGRSERLAECLGVLLGDRDRPRNDCAARPFMARTAGSSRVHGDPAFWYWSAASSFVSSSFSRHSRCEMNRIALLLLTGVALVSGCVAVSPETTRTRGDGPARMSANRRRR